jgi:hypothetical protein
MTRQEVAIGDVRYFGWGTWTVIDRTMFNVIIEVRSNGSEGNIFSTYTTTIDFDDWFSR